MGQSGPQLDTGGTRMATCSHVGAALGAKFCSECGTTLATNDLTERRLCLWCAAPSPATSRFCDRCGTGVEALHPGLPLPWARFWAECFTEMGWGGTDKGFNSPIGLGKKFGPKLRGALEEQLGPQGADPPDPWIMAIGRSASAKPGMLKSSALRGGDVRQTGMVVVATRTAIATYYYKTKRLTYVDEPMSVAVLPFVHASGASWSGSTLWLATPEHQIELEIRPLVSRFAKFNAVLGAVAAVGGVATSDSQLERNAYGDMQSKFLEQRQGLRAVEIGFDLFMQKFCEQILAVSPGGLPRAGWYPDPYRRMQWRWWDGVRWTARCAVNSSEVSDPDYPRDPIDGVTLDKLQPLPVESRGLFPAR